MLNLDVGVDFRTKLHGLYVVSWMSWARCRGLGVMGLISWARCRGLDVMGHINIQEGVNVHVEIEPEVYTSMHLFCRLRVELWRYVSQGES